MRNKDTKLLTEAYDLVMRKNKQQSSEENEGSSTEFFDSGGVIIKIMHSSGAGLQEKDSFESRAHNVSEALEEALVRLFGSDEEAIQYWEQFEGIRFPNIFAVAKHIMDTETQMRQDGYLEAGNEHEFMIHEDVIAQLIPKNSVQ